MLRLYIFGMYKMTFSMFGKLSFGSVLPFSIAFLTKGAIALGILVRVNQYLFNRSLWADEAKLALNIVERNYWELTQALDYNQAAPLGFLFIEKFAIQLFGNQEYALRLFPLFCGIAALLLFYSLVRQYLNPIGVLIAVTLFAGSSSLIYYSTEVKQYASDVAIALLVFLILIETHRQECDRRRLALAGGVGALAVWFSFPVIFVLAGVEASYWIKNFWEGRSQGKALQVPTARLPMCLAWAVSFGGMYGLLLHGASNTDTLLDFWSNKFPTSIFDLDWLFASLKKFFVEPMDFRTPEFFSERSFLEIVDEAAMVAFLVGCFAWYKQQKATLLLFLAPTIATLAAAYLQKFPFEDRLVLFLVPFFLAIIAAGLSAGLQVVKPRYLAIASMALTALLLLVPLAESAPYFFTPNSPEHIKPVLAHLQQNRQPGDVTYVFQKGQYPFLYYADRYGYKPGDYIFGINDTHAMNKEQELQMYAEDVERLKGNLRVWILVSDTRIRDRTKFVLAHLQTIGKRLEVYKSSVPSSFVELYDLR